MAKGYVVAHIDVEDADGYRDYIAAATAAVSEFGGRFLVRGGASEQREGSLRSRHAIIEFPDLEQARAFYDSGSYGQARAIRQKFAVSDLVVVEGVEI